MLLEGHGRKRESTGIRRDATSPQVRKENKSTAEAIYHARMTQLAKAKVGLPINTGMTFGKFSEWYETHHIAKHRGHVRERFILAHLRAHFSHVPLTDIKPARWTEYETQRLKAGVGVNTIGRELTLMKSILNAAVGEHIEVSPLAHLKRKTKTLPAKRTLTKADEVALLEQLTVDVGPRHTAQQAARETQARHELRDLYLVGVGTLLRQMNLITLQRKQHRGRTLVAETKTGPHQVPLTGPTVLQQRAATVLRRRMPKTADGYFFPIWHARFTKDRNAANAKFLDAFRRACKRAGIPWGLDQHGVVWHTATRASGATRMLRDYAIDVRTVQLIGGWRSLDQMAVYLGVDLTHPAGAVSRSTKSGAYQVHTRSGGR